jgi:hypothetical protein
LAIEEPRAPWLIHDRYIPLSVRQPGFDGVEDEILQIGAAGRRGSIVCNHDRSDSRTGFFGGSGGFSAGAAPIDMRNVIMGPAWQY